MGSISYTLVSSPRDSTIIVDSGSISNLHIFDFDQSLTSSSPCTQLIKQISLYYLARGFWLTSLTTLTDQEAS
jgi:hypothetical protein